MTNSWELSAFLRTYADTLWLLITAPAVQAPPEKFGAKFNGGEFNAERMVAFHYLRQLRLYGNLDTAATVLDIGCGYGRIARELAWILTPEQSYIGLDPSADGIDWARQTLSLPNFSFIHADLYNGSYNPKGTLSPQEYRLPFPDGSIDLVFMISVLTHINLRTVEQYFKEVSRVLQPGTGRLLATAFLFDDAVTKLVAEGRSVYSLRGRLGQSRVESEQRPEDVVAHPSTAVEEMLEKFGLKLQLFIGGSWSGRPQPNPQHFQDLLVVTPSSAPKITQADTEMWEITRDLEPKLASEGIDNHDHVISFIIWVVGLILNIKRWRDAELQFVLFDPRSMETAALPENSFYSRLTDSVDQSAGDHREYKRISEEEILVVVAQLTKDSNGVPFLRSLLVDILEAGVWILGSLRSGRQPVLISNSDERTLIDLPDFTWT